MLLSRSWNNGGGAIPPSGGERPSLRDLLTLLTGLTIAELKDVRPDERQNGMKAITSDGRRWRFHSTSALTTDSDRLLVIPTVGSGRWLLEPGQLIDIACPIVFGTADAAVLYTVPTGAAFLLEELFWEVTTPFAGGSSSAIGVSSTKTAPVNWSTKGDLLGGAGGDVEATLVAGAYIPGTIGTDWDTLAKRRMAVWVATNIFRFDRIASVFTSGAGNVRILGRLLANAGA